MRIHYLQHVAFEDAANIRVWAEDRGHAVTSTRLDLDQPLPEQTAFDWLVVMGGPMNIYQHDAFPWLAREKQFLRDAIQRGVGVLGVCLGAQLAADVLGGKVTRNRQKEIGWLPVSLTAEGERSAWFRGFPPSFTAFHWHGDTFSIPPGAVRLAASDACANQAFQYGDRVLGLQFHLDYSQESIEKMIAHCGEELLPGPTVQRAAELRSAPRRVAEIRRLLDRLLDAMAAGLGERD
jgi:GMP synthase-like glutamine amidotransferase